MNHNLYSTLMIRIFAEEKCYGPGVNTLLKRVEEHHSLRAAAQSMSMAYSKAWKIIKTCEELLQCKLLSNTTGGSGGGGAALTEQAKKLMVAYDEYTAEMEAFSQQSFHKHFHQLLSHEEKFQ